jgi:hypothetical protein
VRTGAASGSEGAAADKLAAGTGRAVGLVLSLRERVMQLEKRNRCGAVEEYTSFAVQLNNCAGAAGQRSV